MGGLAVYGLSIILTMDDQISSKVGGINSSLQSLSQTAMSMTYVGKSLMNIGKSMLSPIVGLSKEIIRVGDDMERTRITFSALYQDAEMAEQKINDIIDYAARTPFEIESLKDCALQFKTLGIEVIGAGSEITDSTGRTRELIDVIGDAGAGLSGVARRGFRDVVYATREFITEGNKLSFLRRLGVDIDAVLEKGYQAKNTLEQISTSAGTTAEERLKAYADLINALHMDDLMHELSGSWTTMMSNMSDVWYKFVKEAGDAGAFQVFKDGLTGILEVGQWLTDKDNPLKDQFFKNLGSAFKTLTKPLDTTIKLLSKAVKGLFALGASHPMLLKLIIAIPTITGLLFVMSGAAIAAKGAMLMFRYGLRQILITTPVLLAKLLLLSAVFGAIGYAWKNDIGGIKTRLNGFLDTVSNAFGEANKIMQTDTQSMIASFQRLRDAYNDTGDWGTGLKVKIIEYKTLWSAFLEYWKLGGYLYDETLDKLSKMGLLPFFTKIAVWTERVKGFGRGFSSWFADVGNTIMNFAKKIRDALDKLFPTHSNRVTGLFDKFSNFGDITNASMFEQLGKTTAKWLPAVLGILKIRKLLFSHASGEKSGGILGMLGKLIGFGGRGKKGEFGFGALFRYIARLSPKNILSGMGNLALMLGSMALIAGAVGAMVSISPKTFLMGAVALAGLEILIAPLSALNYKRFSNTIKSLAKINVKTMGLALLKLGELFVGMTAIIGIVGAITSIKPAWFYRGALMVGLIEVLLAPFATPFYAIFSKSMQSLAKFKAMTFVKAIGNLAILFGGMALLVGVLGAITSLTAVQSSLISGITAFGLIGNAMSEFISLKSIAFVAGVCGLGFIDIGTFSMGVANFAVIIGGMVTIMEALGWLGEWDKKMIEHLSVASEALGLVGEAIGRFVGSIVGGAVLGMTDSLPKAGENIAGFFKAIKPYMNVEQAGLLVKFFDSLIRIKTSKVKKKDLKGLAESLNTFVKEAKPFFKFIKNTEVETAEKAKKIMTALGYIGEKASAIKGSDFSSGIGLSAIAMSLNNSVASFQEFLNKTNELDLSGLPNATKLFRALNEWYGLKNLRQGGVKSWWSGDIDLTDIANKLNGSIDGFNSWFSACKDLDEEGMNKSTTFFNTLASWFSHSELKMGGFKQVWSGEIDLSYIANDLNESRQNFTNWFNSAKLFDFLGMQKTNRLFEMLGTLGKADIKAGFWKGTKDGTAGSGLVDVANGLKNSSSIFGEAFTAFKEMDDDGMNKLDTVIDKLSHFGYIKDLIYDLSTTLPSFSEGLKSFGIGAKSFFEHMTTIRGTDIDGVMEKLTSFMSTIANYDISKVSTLGTSLESLGSGLGLVGENSANAKNNFGELGTQINILNLEVSNMAKDIPLNCTLVTDAITGMYNTAKETLGTFAESGQSYGSTLVSNIAKAITDNTYRIKLALTSAVNSAASNITVRLPISPLLPIGHNAKGTMNWRGGLTELHERGGEIVDLPKGTRIYPHDESVNMAFNEGVKEAIKALKDVKTGGNEDNSVHFHEGSIVVYAQNASEEEAERLAERVVEKIENKLRRKKLATYAY